MNRLIKDCLKLADRESDKEAVKYIREILLQHQEFKKLVLTIETYEDSLDTVFQYKLTDIINEIIDTKTYSFS
jgi:uncharacterized protein Yka (UPF0111/DUF47 family)